MFRRLLVILVVPALAVLALGTLLAQSARNDARNANQAARLTELVELATALDTALGWETVQAASGVIDDDVRVRTDEALAAFAGELTADEPELLAVHDLVRETLWYRGDVATGIISPLQIGDRYSRVRAALRYAVGAEVDEAGSLVVGSGLRQLVGLMNAGAAVVDEQLGIELAIRYDNWAPGQLGGVVGAIERQVVHLSSSGDVVMPDGLDEVRQTLLTTNELPQWLTLEQWQTISAQWSDGLASMVDEQAEATTTRANDVATEANRRSRRTVTLVIIILTLGVGLAVLVALRLGSRIDRLNSAASLLASRPEEQLEVNDENDDPIGELARTFDTMAGRLRGNARRQRLESAALASIANHDPLAVSLAYCNQLIDHQGEFALHADGVRLEIAGRKLPLDAPEITRSAPLALAAGLAETAQQRIADLADLERRANYDLLTGVMNRAAILSHLNEVCARPVDADNPGRTAVLYLDLDGFKAINDRHGHTRGDSILAMVGDMLRRSAAEIDGVVGRLGGDEFAVVLTGVRSRAELAAMGHRLGNELISMRVPRSMEIGVSIGGAMVEVDQGAQDLLGEADAAMYVAKRQAGTKVVIATEELRAQNLETERRERAVRVLLASSDFGAVFQPVFDSSGRHMFGVEALCRPGPSFGGRGPAMLWTTASRLGLARPLDLAMLELACRRAAEWHGEGLDVPISVNLSPPSVGGAALVSDVCDALVRTGCPPSMLILEMTEEQLIRDLEGTAARLQQLRDIGVRIAIDDFGTGYSSLAYLAELPADILKLDRSFVDGIDTNARNQAIVSTIVGLAGALDLVLVAEGVARIEERDQLEALGVDMVQGFLFATPLEASEVATRIRAQQGAALEPTQ